jgi:hypothetical protein
MSVCLHRQEKRHANNSDTNFGHDGAFAGCLPLGDLPMWRLAVQPPRVLFAGGVRALLHRGFASVPSAQVR